MTTRPRAYWDSQEFQSVISVAFKAVINTGKNDLFKLFEGDKSGR